LKNILLKKGEVKLYKIKYNKFKAQKKVLIKHTTEYIWFVNVKRDKTYEEINF